MIYKINILEYKIKLVIILRIIFLLGFLSFLKNRGHLLIILLRIEIISLGILRLVLVNLIVEIEEFFFFFIVFMVCESCLGLGLMILISNFFGTEKIRSIKLKLI